ncbi:MAG TPA: hypothetical protein VFZ40_21710 [Pyrinomonadaceae bacterium]
MIKPNRHHYLQQGLLFLCGLTIVIGSPAISNSGRSALSQGQRKRISKGIVIRNIEGDPVKIKEMKVGAIGRRFEEDFDDSDDWLKKLSLEIKNDWSKPIVYLSVALSFPETESSGQRMTFTLPLGNRPGSSAKRENLSFSPGDKLVINMADYHEWIMQFLHPRHSVSQINKAEIQIQFAVFGDQTAWGGGEFFVPDPYNPDRYNNVGTNPPKP